MKPRVRVKIAESDEALADSWGASSFDFPHFLDHRSVECVGVKRGAEKEHLRHHCFCQSPTLRPAYRYMVRWGLGLFVIATALLLSGCGWLERASGDPKHEPHFMEGDNLKGTAQFEAAREAFQKAVEVNPANYFAHQELGDLYLRRFNDPGTALYHYRRYIEIAQKLHIKNAVDPTVETCIQGCEIKLAERTVDQLAREHSSVVVEQLRRDNDSLRQQLEEAQRQLQVRAQESRTVPNLNSAIATNRPPEIMAVPPSEKFSSSKPKVETARVPVPTGPIIGPRPGPAPIPTLAPHRPSSAKTTYVIRAGDNPATIARAHGLKLPALLAANPGLDARHLKVGQTINLPSK